MKENIKERSLRVLAAVMLGLMMVAGGVLPGGMQEAHADSQTFFWNGDGTQADCLFWAGGSSTLLSGDAAYCLNGSNTEPSTTGTAYSNVVKVKRGDEVKQYLGFLGNDGTSVNPDLYADPNINDIFTTICYLGYPNDGEGLLAGLSRENAQKVTQEAVYYYVHKAGTGDTSNVIVTYMKDNPNYRAPDSYEVEVWLSGEARQNMLVAPKAPKGPAVDNTTVTATVGSDSSTATNDTPASASLSAGQSASITDTVKLKSLDSTKSYVIVSGIYKRSGETATLVEGSEVRTNVASSEIQGDGTATKPVTFTKTLDAEGTYTIVTKLYEGSETAANLKSTHNGNYKDTMETIEVEKDVADIEVEKKWVDEDGTTAVAKPSSGTIKYQLQKKTDSDWSNDGDPVTVNNGANNWGYKWTDKSKKDGSTTIEYRVIETECSVEGFKIKQDQEDGVAVDPTSYKATVTNVKQPIPEIGTLVSAGNKSAKAATASEDAKPCTLEAQEADSVTEVVDTLSYKHLAPSSNYTVTATLYEVSDGTLGDKVTEATVENQQTEASGSGTWTINIPLPEGKKLEPGKSYVVYEKATYAGDTPLEPGDKANEVKHENPKDQAQTIVVQNYPTPVIKISKTDLGGTEIEGADMRLYDDNGDITDDRTLVKEWTSSAEGPEEFELEPGDYVLKEVIAPDGFAQVSTDMKFTVNVNGSVKLNTVEVDSGGVFTILEGTENHIVLKDAPAFDILISKNVLGGNEVAGAKMKLEGGPDNLTAEWISSAEPEMFKVREGKYTLTEVTAPAGLQKVTTKMEFTVDAEGKVTLTKATADNGGAITVKEGTDNHIVLEDAPIEPVLTKTVNGGKKATLSSKDEAVEFKLTTIVPYGVEEFIISDPIPDPLVYVDGTLKATLAGKDVFNYDPGTGQYGYSTTNDKNVEVVILSPTVDGVEGPSSIIPADAWGNEVEVTFKCKLDPEEDLKKYKETTNIAFLTVDGKVYSSFDGNKAKVLGIYELADEDEPDTEPDVNPDDGLVPDDTDEGDNDGSSRTGDNSPLAVLLIALFSSAAAVIAIRRRRVN